MGFRVSRAATDNAELLINAATTKTYWTITAKLEQQRFDNGPATIDPKAPIEAPITVTGQAGRTTGGRGYHWSSEDHRVSG
jgi:hypothetical protein